MVLFYDLPGDRQAKPCTAVFGRIERLEDALNICFINAAAASYSADERIEDVGATSLMRRKWVAAAR